MIQGPFLDPSREHQALAVIDDFHIACSVSGHLSGAHTYSFPRVIELLKENNAQDISVIGGGIFPIEDVPALKAIGIREIFEPGAKLNDITDWVGSNMCPRGAIA